VFRKGILAGVVVGVALYVIWRRSQTQGDAGRAAVPAEPVATPASVVPEPAEPAPEAVAETAPEPEAVAEPEPEPQPEPQAAETSWPMPVPAARSTEERARRPAPLTHAGRHRDLTTAGWLKDRRAPTFSGSPAVQPHARASWPGVSGAGRLHPSPLRTAPVRARPQAFSPRLQG
jgi:translation initiation factor IF-2